MIQYLYAFDTNDSLIDISTVTTTNRSKYHCPSCGKEMCAVLGNKREHHFRHKGDSCSYESYLHKISKMLLKWRFEYNPVFEVAYYAKINCTNKGCRLRESECNSNVISLHKINLKEIYNLCEIEGVYNGYRADVKLSNTNKPELLPLFLEVAVSHKCSPEKISSGIPIIEIPVTNERDVLRAFIETKNEPHAQISSYINQFPHLHNILQPIENSIKFYNFNRDICPEKDLARFMVYKDKNGTLRGAIENNIGICASTIGIPNDNALFEIQFNEADCHRKYPIWYFGMYLAIDNDIKIQDCRICRNYTFCCTLKIDTKTNRKIAIPISRLNHEQYDTAHASNCRNFIYNTRLKSQILDYFTGIKYHICKLHSISS